MSICIPQPAEQEAGRQGAGRVQAGYRQQGGALLHLGFVGESLKWAAPRKKAVFAEKNVLQVKRESLNKRAK